MFEKFINLKIDVETKDALKETKKLQREIDKLEEKKKVTINLQEETNAKIIEAQQKKRAAEQKLSSMMKDPNTSVDDWNKQKALIKGYDKEIVKLTNTSDKYTGNIIKADEEIAVKQDKIKELTKNGIIPEDTPETIKKSNKGVDEFSRRIKGLLKSIFVFSLIGKGLREIKDLFSKIVLTNDDARQAIADLKGTLYTLIVPFMNIVMPFVTKLINALNYILTQIAKTAAGILGLSLAEAANNAQSMYESLQDAQGTVAGFDELNDIGSNDKSIEANFGNIGTAALTDEVQKTADIIMAVIGALVGLKIATSLINIIGTINSLGISLSAFLPILAGIALAIGGIILLVKGIQEIAQNGITWKAIGLIAAGILAIGAAIAIAVGWPALVVAAIVAAVTAIVLIIIKYWDEIVAWFKQAWVDICAFFSNIVNWLYQNVILPIGNFFVNMWNGIKSIFAGVGTFFSDIFTNATNGIRNIWNGIITFFQTAWARIKSIFSGVGAFFSTIFSGVKNTLKDVLNIMIDLLNRMINGVNVLITPLRAIIVAVGKMFGATWTLSTVRIPNIPRLAQGAVVPPNKEFLAMLGDNTKETEIVSPLSTMKQAFLDALSQNGAGSTNELLEELIAVVQSKNLTISPSANLGRVIAKSSTMYRGVTG